jgi:transcriptional regulator with XRE-family HTH domain
VADHPEENLPQLIAKIRAEYGVNEPQIAAAIGVHVSTINTWASGKRGGKRGPRRENLQALHEAYPKFSAERIFAAAKREAPGPPDEDAETRVLGIYRELTEEQRRMSEIQMRALRDSNRTGQ